MIYIVFSDVHGNLEALEAFFAIADSLAHDYEICLGDLVGYGADPNGVVERVRARADLMLAGNHDHAALGKVEASYFSPVAFQSCLWTRDALIEENRHFLDSLGARQEWQGICWAHSSPFEPEEWHYLDDPYSDAGSQFGSFIESLCFVGHTHRTLLLEQTAAGEVVTHSHPPAPFYLRTDSRYIVNAGSVGQPRDGNPDPSYVIYDSAARTVEFRRFRYDNAAARAKILAHGLPPILGDRLLIGR